MLSAAAICLVLVGAMHSFLGGLRLISPLLARPDFPSILGSQRNARLTLFFGWHALTVFWWAQAYVLWTIATEPSRAIHATLLTLAIASCMLACAAIIASRGRHLSWVFFLPITILLVCVLIE
ncbi:hypothetical protein [Pukyongiella litopenaei]|uniref:Uncharacterized protein n=1 Tax=Pukyongiella litopenaei TaxID=2605946 RepID=A0A2S0MN72_9RHOB|nr:hypothetical protein [Pukyongiella litopenaei]AVO37163.2 hypothetical protein C6Y53_05225 [Pukyongiella litopenaei]